MKKIILSLALMAFTVSQAYGKTAVILQTEPIAEDAEMICGLITTKSKPLYSTITSRKKGTYLLADADQFKAQIKHKKVRYSVKQIKAVDKHTINWCGCYYAALDKENKRITTIYNVRQLTLNSCKSRQS